MNVLGRILLIKTVRTDEHMDVSFFVRCRRTYVLDNTCINQVYKLHRKKYFDRFDLFFKNNI